VVTDNILKNVQAIFPKDKSSELVNTLERLSQRTTDFIRGNPLVSTAAVGIGVTGLVASATSIFKRRRKKKTSVRKRKSVKRPSKRRGKKKTKAQIKRQRIRNLVKARRARGKKGRTHSSPRHKGHKRVSFTTATGKKVNFLVGKRKHKRRIR